MLRLTVAARICVLAVALQPALAFAQDTTKAAPPTLPPAELQRRVDWLKQHAAPIRSVDPADTDFSDLAPIGRAIGNATVVLLGEQSHGDGTVFLAKARLIRYLHEQLGFDVLAFESGLYDTKVAWEKMKAGEDALTAFRRGVFGIWNRSEQLMPLVDYLGLRAKSSRPLELSGFDSQFTASASRELFLTDLLKFLGDHNIDASAFAPGTDARLVLDSLALNRYYDKRPTEAQQKAFFDGWAALRQKAATLRSGDREVAFWQQNLKSIEAHARYTFARDPSRMTAADNNGRDAQMGENLVWLANERFKGRKIIVWAATFHNARFLSDVATGMPNMSYDGLVPMGEVAWKALGPKMYSIGFIASEGKVGSVGRPARDLTGVSPESLEGLWAATGAQLGFLDFRALPADSWLRAPVRSGPLGYAPMLADWTKVLDGVVYTRVMVESRTATR